MAAAQSHVLQCDGCAAHDTLVRRSLMLARSVQTIEPSEEFQARLRARLASCRAEPAPPPRMSMSTRMSMTTLPAWRKGPRTVAAVATGALLGTLAWNTLAGDSAPPVVAMQPVIATQPEYPASPYVTPALMQAMSTGNPVWPAAVLLEDMGPQLVAVDFETSR